MADKMTPEQRSKCMAAVKSKNTKPELIVRKFLFSKGLRYRIHKSSLPGKPDIVLPKYKTVIFINGCFWHGHDGCRNFRMPKSNIVFWQNKILSNKNRDLINEKKLNDMGWNVIRIWECEITHKDNVNSTLENVYNLIIKPVKKYNLIDNTPQMAAENDIKYGM